MFNYHTVALISHAIKVISPRKSSTVRKPRTSRYVQAGFRKGRGLRDQIANICLIIKKARQFQENIYFCFIDYTKAFDYVDHNKLWKILQEKGFQTT